jgi:hypothetical protein
MVEALKIKLERMVVEEVVRRKRIPYRIDEEQNDNPDVGVFIPHRGIDRKVSIEVAGYYSAYPKNPETPRQKKLLESSRAIATWIRTDNTDAFIRQISQKFEKAKRYRKGFNALWLLYYFDMIGVYSAYILFFWQERTAIERAYA